MANNPIDTNSFRHFLLIRGVEYEIIEPVNFDKENFKGLQDNYARDIFFGNEEEELEFYQNFGEQGQTFINNDGVLVSHIPSGLDLLLEENKNYGSEADVKRILKKDNVSFTTGNLDFSTAETDGESYFKCKVIQNTNQSKIKKREKITIDLLATKDIDDNTIDAIPVQKMLLKAKPIYGESRFECPNQYSYNFTAKGSDNPAGDTSSMFYFYNNCQSVIKFNIEDTLGFLDQTLTHNGNIGDDWDNRNDQGDLFGILRAKDDLSNIKINIKDLIIQQQGDSDNGGNGYAETYFVLRWGFDINAPSGGINLLYNFIDENGNTTQNILDNTYTIPFLPSGYKVWLYFRTKVRQSATNIIGDPRMECFTNISQYSVDITATSTAIDSVINAVRWIDLIKQNYKAIGSLPVNAPKFDEGGEFYDNFCFSKNLIAQNLEKPFYVDLNQTKESLQEVNADAQINENEIYIGQYTDFYKNIDLGGFLEIPDNKANFIKNDKYLINKFVFGYEKYEQDRNERNTVDAIHTNSEWFVQTQNSINTKDTKLPFIRDAFSIETARRSVFSIKENSDSTDDNIFIADVVQLAPNTRRKFTRLVSWQADGGAGTTKILSDNSFSWDLLGFSVGDTIIESGVSRTVLAITPNLLTLSFSGGFASGTNFLTFDYPLTNVLYTNRTNEGLIFSTNLRNSDNFSNLRYSIKRNMRHWFPNLATYGKFIPTKKIKNSYFKANGEAITQFSDEVAPIKENEDIIISDIASFKILNQDIYKTTVRCSFEKVVQLLKDLQNVRGFVRVQTPSESIIKGYVKELNYIWSSEELQLELECKNESDFLNVVYSGGIFTINEVGYDTKTTTEKRYNIFNDYIQFFDENSIYLCNRTKFDKVSLNGITYSNIEGLVNALELL